MSNNPFYVVSNNEDALKAEAKFFVESFIAIETDKADDALKEAFTRYCQPKKNPPTLREICEKHPER